MKKTGQLIILCIIMLLLPSCSDNNTETIDEGNTNETDISSETTVPTSILSEGVESQIELGSGEVFSEPESTEGDRNS